MGQKARNFLSPPPFLSSLVTFERSETRSEERNGISSLHLAVGHNRWYHFGVGAPPILVYFGGWIESDVHWGLTDLACDPWPFLSQRSPRKEGASRARQKRVLQNWTTELKD